MASLAARTQQMKRAVQKVGFLQVHKQWLVAHVERGRRSEVERETYITHHADGTSYGLVGIQSAMYRAFPGTFEQLNETLFRCVISHFLTKDPDGPQWAPLGATQDRHREVKSRVRPVRTLAQETAVETLALAELKRRLRKMPTSQLARLARGK